MKLTAVFAISFFILSLFLGVGLVYYSYLSLEENLKESVYSHLETAAKVKADQVKLLLDGKRERSIDFSSDGFIKNSLYKIKNNKEIEQTVHDLNYHLLVNKLPVDKSFYEVSVLDTKGKIISSTDVDGSIGLELYADSIFLKGKEGDYSEGVFYDEVSGNQTIALSAPILRKGEFMGVILIKMLPDLVIDIMTERTGLGETGEVYIINEEGFLITPSRFLKGENKGIMTQIVETENSEECLNALEKYYNSETSEVEAHKHNIVIFKDYRGKEVFGNHSFVPKMKWCVLAEIDEAETLGNEKRNFAKRSSVIIITLVIIITFIGFFIGRFLDKKYAFK